MGTTLHLLVIVLREEEGNETFCTWPPLVIEKILDVPPHCLTYHRNQRAETSWGSDVTFTFTKTVAKSLTALHETQDQEKTVRKLLPDCFQDFICHTKQELLSQSKKRQGD